MFGVMRSALLLPEFFFSSLPVGTRSRRRVARMARFTFFSAQRGRYGIRRDLGLRREANDFFLLLCVCWQFLAVPSVRNGTVARLCGSGFGHDRRVLLQLFGFRAWRCHANQVTVDCALKAPNDAAPNRPPRFFQRKTSLAS
jgi:hypothetical protein